MELKCLKLVQYYLLYGYYVDISSYIASILTELFTLEAQPIDFTKFKPSIFPSRTC